MHKNIRTIFVSLIVVMLLAGFSGSVNASTLTWTGGGTDNLASNPANWSGGITPQYGDDVVFDSTSKDCTWDLSITLASLSIKSGYIGKVTKTSGVNITIAKNFVPPTSPSGLSATAISSSQINLSWTDNSNNETGFKIERKTGTGGTYSQIALVGANITTYSDTGLTGGTTYYYKARAYNSFGDSGYSNEVSAATFATAPVATTNPATDITDNSATLNGLVNPNGLDTTFYFEWGTTTSYGNSTSSQSIGSGTSNVSITANLTSLLSNTTYNYRVVAANSNGTSYGSNMSFTTTAIPTGTIQVNATLDGANWSGSVNYSLTGPENINSASVPQTFSGKLTGTYTLTYNSGAPSGAALSSITPSATQTLGVNGIITYTLNFISPPASNWYNTSWQYRQQITISKGVTNANLNDFPILVKITDQNNTLFNKALSNGYDILFTSSDGITKLNHEIEYFQNTAAKELDAWVNVPALSSSQDTVIYMYYGNSSASNQENPQAVWDSNYKGAWHLKEDMTGTGSLDLYKDSTVNNNHGDDYVSAAGQEGQINSGQEFDGSDDYINAANNASLGITSQITIEAWIKIANPEQNRHMRIVSKKASWNSSYGYELEYNPSTNILDVLGSGSNYGRANSVNLDTNWHYVSGVINGTVATLYVDGINVTTDNTVTALASDTRNLRIGKQSGGTDYFNGSIDEVRISSTARSADWITASFNSQKTPETYLSYGAEESSEGTPTGTIEVKATLDGTDWSGLVNFTLTGPETINGASTPATLSGKLTGTYTLTYNSGGPSGAALNSITPSAAQTLQTDGTVTFTLAFTQLYPPIATTNPASNIGDTIATLNAIVNPKGLETTVYFELGTDTSYGVTTVPQSIGNGTGDVSVVANLTGLAQSFTYYYRVVATNSNGTSYGSNMSFTTTGISIGAISVSAAIDGANWSGSVNFTLTGPETINGTSPALFSNKPTGTYTLTYISGGPSNAIFNGINPSNTQTLSQTNNLIIFTLNFSSTSPPADPSNLTAIVMSPFRIDLSWTNNSSNEAGFKIERKTGVGGTYSQIADVNGPGYLDMGLTVGTTYYYRVRAYNSSGNSAYSNEASATTLIPLPAPTTWYATNVTSTSATLNADIDPNSYGNDYGYEITAYFEWGTDISYGNNTTPQSIGSGNNVVSANLTGLTPSTTYHYRVVASNAGGTSYGGDMSFTTDAATSLLPDTTTNPATNVNANSATLNATVNPNGSGTSAYFEWGSTISYGNISAPQSIGNGTSNVSVTDTLLGLLPNTTYHYRIVATNAGGTNYGNDISFTTSAGTDVSGTISTNTTWTLAGSPYIVTGHISIYDPTITLTIEPGVVVKFNEGTSLYIYGGVLKAQGTAISPITFTSNQQVTIPGQWYGISFDSSSGENILEYVTVEYGGSSNNYNIYQYNSRLTIKNSTIRYNSNGGIFIVGNSTTTTTTIIDSNISDNGTYGIYTGWGSLWGTVDVSISGSTITNNGVYGIYIYDGSNISITNSTISNNGTYGVYIDSYIYDLGTYQAPYISNTSFENNTTYPISMVPYSAGNLGSGNSYNNNGTDGVELRGNYIESDTTLPYQNAPYIVTNGMWLGRFQAMPTLTIAPGVVIKFNAGKSLEVSGVLKAQGTSSAPIVFTSNQNPSQPGDWYGIRFYNHAATESILEYVTVEYAGYGGYGNIYLSNNSPTIKNSAIKNSNNYGIYSSGDSSPIITGSTISTNGIHGVYARGTGKADITFNTFISNTNYAIYSEVPVLNINHNNIENNGNGIFGINGKRTDARFNWWGNATGPSGQGPGSGQSVSYGVNFEPWLSTSYTYPFYNTNFSATLQEFSPLNNSVNYTFTISENSNWTFSIKNSGGTTVRTFTGSGNAGTVTWDGKDENNVIVPDGIYTYQLESISLSNGSQSAPLIGDVTVGSALPKAEITSPVHGQFIGLFDIQGTAADTDFKDYEVEYGLGTAPETWTLITSSTTQINNGPLATWNPSALTGTYYTIRLSVNDLTGNTATDSVEVQLLMNNLLIDPSNFSPNGDGFEDTIKITAQLSQPKDWTLNIKNSDGTLIKSFSGSGTSLSVIWDGKNTSGIIQPEGVYPFTITTVDTALGAGEITIDLTPSPEAITDDVVTFWTNSATLRGSVNPRAFETTVYFEWGMSNNPYENRTTSASIGSGTQFINIESKLIGLSPGMTYHYRIVATNANGTSYGSDKIFITRGTAKPDAITDFATNITDNSVTLNATVNPRGAITTAYFEWGTTSSYGNTTSVQSIGYGTESVSILSNITQLLPNTTYHYRVIATNDNETSYGSDMSFTTTGTPTGTIQINATLDGVAWGGSVNYALSGPENINGSFAPTTFSGKLTGTYTLTYTSDGPSGAVLNSVSPLDTQTLEANGTIIFTLGFVTIVPPTATTLPATNINGNSTTLNATVSPNGAGTTVYFQWGTSVSYGNTTSSQPIGNGTSPISVSANLTGLSPNTTYHYRIVASNTNGTTNGLDVTFTTPPITITITTPLDSSTINKPYVMVTGTVTNSTGNETGVTVNGMVAAVYGNEFIANNVPLQEGQNTITATATDTGGNTATASIAVNAVTTVPYITLSANIESGISPLEVTLKIDGSFSITNSTVTYTGPTQPEFLSSSADEYRVRMTVEGIYYFTANVTGPDGNTYQDTVAIVVLNQANLDALLKAKWEAMKTSLGNGDINVAVSNFDLTIQGVYIDQFTALSPILQDIVNELNTATLNMVSAENKIAEYEILVVREGTSFSLHLKFILDDNGIWRIWAF